MVPRAAVLLTLLLSACQSTNPSSTVGLRQQENPPVAPESSLHEVSSVPSCAKKELMTKFLAKTFNEKPILRGVSTDGSILTIYAGPNGAWTLTKIVNDITCILAGGTGLKVLRSEKGKMV